MHEVATRLAYIGVLQFGPQVTIELNNFNMIKINVVEVEGEGSSVLVPQQTRYYSGHHLQ